jgi:hypothetical protein
VAITPSYKAMGLLAWHIANLVAVWLKACNHPAGCRVILKEKLWMLNAIATHNTKVWPSGSCKRIFDPTFMVSDSILFINSMKIVY